MKKFLFTLATLIAAGFAANAGAPEFEFSTNLVDLTPGGDPVEVKVILTKDAGEVVAGGQLQFVIRDANGGIVDEDVVVVQQNLGTPRVPNYQYFRPGVIMDDMSVPVSSSHPFTGKYRILLANTSTNIIMMGDELEYYSGEGIEPVLCTFQLQASENWDGQYVTLNLEANPKSMEEQGEDEYPNKWSIPGGSQTLEDGAMAPIQINNTEYASTTTPLEGTITIGDNDGFVVPITVAVNGTYDLVVTYTPEGGEAVTATVENGTITLPGYGTYVINATATGNGDYEGTVTAEAKTITIEQPVADTPVITFTPAEDGGVDIAVAPCTSYEVIVDGENMGQITHVAPIYDATQTVVVNATNAPQGYVAANATDQTTVAEKAYAPAVTPTIDFETAEDGTVTIVIGDATRYEVTVDGEPYEGLTVAPIYDATQEIVVKAWNEAQYQETGYYEATTTVAEKPYAPAVNPEISFDETANGVTITVDPYTSYEVIVDGVNMGQINYVAKTYEVQNITVNAVNEPEHQLKGEASKDYELAALGDADLTGTLTIGAVDQATGKVHIAYVGEEDVTIEVTYGVREVVTINGKEGDIQLTEKGVTYHIVAVAKAAHYVDKTAEADRIWEKTVYDTPAPNVTYDEDTYTITATGEGTVAIYVAGQQVAEGQGTVTYTIPQTDVDQYVSYWATATATGDYDEINPGMSASATAFVPAKEAPQPEQVATPIISTPDNCGFLWHSDSQGLNNMAYKVTIDCATEGAAIEYRITDGQGNVTDWMPYTGAFIIHGNDNETWVVEARATAPEMIDSNIAVQEFVMTAVPTSIEELMSAENVANVRFFNVAGQEMQEANGMTIVVVTFTNGQTVSTKIMK